MLSTIWICSTASEAKAHLGSAAPRRREARGVGVGTESRDPVMPVSFQTGTGLKGPLRPAFCPWGREHEVNTNSENLEPPKAADRFSITLGGDCSHYFSG